MILSIDCKVIIFKYLPLNQQLQALVTKFCQKCGGSFGPIGLNYSPEKTVAQSRAKLEQLKLLLQTFGLDITIIENIILCGHLYYATVKHKTMVTYEIMILVKDKFKLI